MLGGGAFELAERSKGGGLSLRSALGCPGAEAGSLKGG